MKTLVCVALLQLCVTATAVLSGNGSTTNTSVTAEPGHIVLLPCYTGGNVTPSMTIWMKNGQEVIRGGGPSSSPDPDPQRLMVLNNGSLRIGSAEPGDGGAYLCNSTLPGSATVQAHVVLRVSSSPANLSTSIGPVTALPNGTLVAVRGSTVFFNCSSSSWYPTQRLTWAFRGDSSSNDSLASATKPQLDYRIDDVQPGSQGVYSCVVNDSASQDRVNRSTQLLVYYVPDRAPECLTVVTQNLSQLQLNCSWPGAYPTPSLRWEGDHTYRKEETDSLQVTLARSDLSDGQTLRCMADHPALAPGKETLCSLTLNVSDRHPDCMWAPAQDPTQLQFICSWFGVNPPPKLRWEREHGQNPIASGVTNSLTVALNHSLLFNGQTVKCVAEHMLFPPGKENSCSFTLRPPYPVGEPMATAVVANNVTLTCTETASFPPANTTWRKGMSQEEITPGPKYTVSQEGASFKLTIHNVSVEDEGVYFCRSQNPLIVTVLEVYLNVKASSANTGAVIGCFIATLIVVATFLTARTLYSRRHQICLGGGFGKLNEGGDVLNLVDSDDEQTFQDSVPQLPPSTNGCQTTMVQIHRIPATDHEDPETTDTSLQQQEDTTEAEEPSELVSY